MSDPPISILMPIKNEEKWLEERIASILNQDYQDYELIITDNASTDQTEAIYQRYAQNDQRIKIYRHQQDIGAAKNFTFAIDQGKGEYLVLAGGHDLWSANFLSALKEKLDSSSKIVISFGKTEYIDGNGRPLEKSRGIYSTEGVSSPLRRFNIYMWADQNPMYGMMRREETMMAWPKNSYMAGGQVFLQRMTIMGQFAYVPEVSFYRRENRAKEFTEQRFKRYQSVLFDQKIGVRVGFWKSALALVGSAWKFPLPGNLARRRRLRFQLVASSLNAFIRFWPYLWHPDKKQQSKF